MNDIRVSNCVREPLPGVLSVLVKGTSVGTITGIDGKYSINVPSDGTLVFSFIGWSVEHKVGGRSVINVELVPDKQLEEVMVVAYTTAKKYSFWCRLPLKVR